MDGAGHGAEGSRQLKTTARMAGLKGCARQGGKRQHLRCARFATGKVSMCLCRANAPRLRGGSGCGVEESVSVRKGWRPVTEGTSFSVGCFNAWEALRSKRQCQPGKGACCVCAGGGAGAGLLRVHGPDPASRGRRRLIAHAASSNATMMTVMSSLRGSLASHVLYACSTSFSAASSGSVYCATWHNDDRGCLLFFGGAVR